ncbi:MAG: exonuclease domain-containing protein [Bacteroidia bacterium]
MRHYAIIDIETSGGNPKIDRITEVCIHRYDGEKLIDSFSTLINPEVSIPYNITRITSITNDMVRKAPKFYEVAKRIVEITEGAIFVAHNVRFDYGFIQKEFRNLGYSYSRPQLCTVRLSQKVFPLSPSHSLENLCKYLGITNEKAHRAYGDATATLKLFEIILKQNSIDELDEVLSEQIADTQNPPNLPPEVFDNLPDETGVYYWHNVKGEVIYVGKSTGIKYRIKSHFREAHKNAKALKMFNEVCDITYQLTGSELVALLLENEEIKRILPKHNRAQRRKTFYYGIFSEPDENNYLRLKIARLNDRDKPESCYTLKASAEAALKRRVERYNLCMNLCGIGTGKGACFHYQVHVCKGACVNAEAPEAYNARVEAAIESMNYGRPNFFIIGEGRNYEERSVVAVKNGSYCGYTYIAANEVNLSAEMLYEMTPYKSESPDVLNIIRNYIKKHPKEVKNA